MEVNTHWLVHFDRNTGQKFAKLETVGRALRPCGPAGHTALWTLHAHRMPVAWVVPPPPHCCVGVRAGHEFDTSGAVPLDLDMVSPQIDTLHAPPVSRWDVSCA